jgi:bla regulator protein BlaR1
MTRLFLECAIRAALVVTGTAIVLYALRVNAARIKHRVWTAVVLLMLLLPLWTAWGPKAPVRVLPPLTESTANQVGVPTSTISLSAVRLDNTSESSEPATRPPVSKLQALLLGIYLLGLFSLLARLAFGTAAAHKLIRQAALRDGRRTSASCAAPVTVGWFNPTVILPEGWQQWPQAQLDAVMTHECEHAQRRDPLVQWLALLNRAVFWFHPVAWWLEWELSALAEEACDSAVLVRGYDARDYAETLMDMARAVMRSGSRVNIVGVAMPGGFLAQRIRHIVENVPAPRISRTRMACVVAVCTITCTAFAAGRLERTRQSPAAPANRPAFDSVSIKLSKSADPRMLIQFQPGGRLVTTNLPVRVLVSTAYQLSLGMGRGAIVDAPDWIDSEHFDIEAKAEGNPTREQLILMLQSLLADRFKLAAHWETRQLPVYALVLSKAGKTGPLLIPHAADNSTCHDLKAQALPPTQPGAGPVSIPAPCGGGFLISPGHIGTESTMAVLAKNLSWFQQIDRAVVDNTGLNGTFDIAIEYAPFALNAQVNADATATESSLPATIFDALREELGLKLESTKGPVNVLVIDHVEQPSPN